MKSELLGQSQRNKESRPSLDSRDCSAPVGIQTPNLLIRSQMLYSVELRVPKKQSANVSDYGHLAKAPICPSQQKTYF
jgi:hypothetical protein